MKQIVFSIITLFIVHFAKGQTLDELLKIAVLNNPKIQQFEWEHKVSLEKENEVNSLPNTEIGVGFFVSEPETRTGVQKVKIGVKQKVPWFGVITARKNYARSLAEAKYEKITIIKRKLVVAVSQSYYKLQILYAKQFLLAKYINVLKSYEELALKGIETGKNSLVDVLKIQLQQNNLQARKEILTHNFLLEQTHLNILLNREKLTAILITKNLRIKNDSILVSTENLKLHPELIQYDKLYKSVEKSELLNQKEQQPMLGFGVDYIAVSERPNLNFNDNGKDILMPMISLSIPIFNKKYNSKTKQNDFQQKKITAQKQERLNTLQTLLDAAIHKRLIAKINFETQDKNYIKTKQAEEVLLKKYETGSIYFEKILELQELQLKLEMKQIEAIKNYYLQTCVIHYLTSGWVDG